MDNPDRDATAATVLGWLDDLSRDAAPPMDLDLEITTVGRHRDKVLSRTGPTPLATRPTVAWTAGSWLHVSIPTIGACFTAHIAYPSVDDAVAAIENLRDRLIEAGHTREIVAAWVDAE